jgi:hypothetical chaperone protein
MHCGLDFGTSNSVIGAARDGEPGLLPLQGESTSLPTAIFYDQRGGGVLIGKEAMNAYLAGEDGRLLRSIKSILGTSLIEESTVIGGRRMPLKQAIGDYIGRLKALAEARLGAPLTAVVHGRPVHFVDGDEAGDRAAEDALRGLLADVGFSQVEFRFEPLAAARHFLHRFTGEALALVVDIGGGTSDFSCVRIQPGRLAADQDILGNHGIRLGGTNFDQVLNFQHVMPHFGRGVAFGPKDFLPPNWIYASLTTWSRIQSLYVPKTLAEVRAMAGESDDIGFERLVTVLEEQMGHAVAGTVEGGKIALSSAETTTLDLGYVDPGFAVDLTVGQLRDSLAESMERMTGAITETLRLAGLGPEAVDLVILTGGSTEMPLIQRAVRAALPGATLEPCDAFGAVGSGLALEAAEIFGPV